MSKRHAELAVSSLAAYLRANYATYLRTVETDQGLDTGELPDPVRVVEARAPFLNESPVIEVYAETCDVVDEPNRVYSTDCTIAWSYTGDADLEASERIMMRSHTALLLCLASDYRLGDGVSFAIPGRAEFEPSLGSDAAIRHSFTLGVEVHTNE